LCVIERATLMHI